MSEVERRMAVAYESFNETAERVTSWARKLSGNGWTQKQVLADMDTSPLAAWKSYVEEKVFSGDRGEYCRCWCCKYVHKKGSVCERCGASAVIMFR